MQNESLWYSFGDACYKGFEILEGTYDLLSPNKILIGVGFVAFAIWLKVQMDYTKKAKKNGTLI